MPVFTPKELSSSLLCFLFCFDLPEHVTPASSEWLQKCFPQSWSLQYQSSDSFPWQETLSSQMGPEPSLAFTRPVVATAVGHPSCLQTTAAFFLFQPSSHTVPHSPWNFTSNLPEHLVGPSASIRLRFAPSVTGIHNNPEIRKHEYGCPWVAQPKMSYRKGEMKTAMDY